MPRELPKTYDPAAIEGPIYQLWLDKRSFSADPAAPGEPYCIVIPPPNVTGALHLGHAINDTLQDILTRTHRMRGFNAVWIPGIDHAGIATQAVVEKQLKEQENKTRHDVGREGLVERIWKWKEQFGARILEQLKRLGCSCDWERTRFTLDDMCARAVRETFFKLFKDGLIYRGKRLVNWDVHLQTSISDDEIYHETVKTSLWHIRYPIEDPALSPSPGTPGEGRGEGSSSSDSKNAPHPSPLPDYRERREEGRPAYVTVATTRPETMLGDTAVAVNSTDPRWNWAIGKMVALPLTDRKIPIIADDILVDPKFGTGVVKVTPAHDPNDYAVWERHQRERSGIEILNILNPNGTLNENAGSYAGMKRAAAREKIVEDLEKLGLLAKVEPYETQVGHSDRSKTPVEPYLSDQWFVKMAPLTEPALEVVRRGIIRFFPERHAQQYLSWLGEKRDWPISRQLWWGHRIPVWRKASDTDSKEIEFGPDTSLTPYTRDSGVVNQPEHMHVTKTGVAIGFGSMYCVGPDQPEIEKALEDAGYVQDPDVLDTWFSSALWPHSTLGWPQATEELAKWYPTSVLVTGRDIITLWVARMVIMGMYNMGGGFRRAEPGWVSERIDHTSSLSDSERAQELGIPFHHVAINPTILDGKGERMSKSKGNGVDPVDVIDTHGADALRFTLTMMATETQDVRMPVKKDSQGRNTSDKFDLGSRFCNKIWQVANFFVIANLEKTPPEPADSSKWTPADKWIISRFNRAVAEVDAALAAYRFDQYAKICYDFFYGDFCDWYVEASKLALKQDPSRAGQTANILAAILDGSLRLMHPMIPFVTETIWQRLNEIRPQRGIPGVECAANELLIKAEWPAVITSLISDRDESIFTKLQHIVTAIRNLRSEHKVDQKRVLDATIIAAYEQDELIANDNKELIESLTTCHVKAIVLRGTSVAASSLKVSAGDYVLAIEGVFDTGVELQRLLKRQSELGRQIQMLQTRMSNESYAANAPAHLVKQTQDQLAQAKLDLEKVEAEIRKISP
ncbi:MAG: valine--tRNA ligase [Tepidisphaeraceae bacterium]|jgi:valyl-tRNA synthetase